MKNSNDIIGNRTRKPPACSAVPQPTAPPRAPHIISLEARIRVFRGGKVVSPTHLPPLPPVNIPGTHFC